VIGFLAYSPHFKKGRLTNNLAVCVSS
jgi:hypothetical protein